MIPGAIILIGCFALILAAIAIASYDRRNAHAIAKAMSRKFGANVTPLNSPEGQRIIKGVDID